ncbi:MAG TPA: Qat anti-phage system TatD family nuclease QatD [Chthoniobacteraceae bacterium]
MIDLHCHLDLYPDPWRVADECRERQLYVLSVTTTPSAWEGTVALAEGSARIRTALGLHPQLAHERKGELALFERLLPQTRYVGEVGLDGGPEYKRHWDDQITVFERVLAACHEAGGRVLSVHSRRAAAPVLDHLEKSPGAGTPVMHWFSGSLRELARAVEFGCWFSVGPAMLAGEKGRALAARMPRDRVLTETDGPFARVENQSAYPWDAAIAVAGLAELWGMPRQEAERLLRDNLRHLASMESRETA